MSGHWVQLTLTANFVEILHLHLLVQFSRLISVFTFVSLNNCLKQSLAQVIPLVDEWIDTYGIHQSRISRSSYWKLVWVGFEPKNTEFFSDTLTEWAIRPLGSTRSQKKICKAPQVLSLYSLFTFQFSLCLRQLPHLLETKSHTDNHVRSELNWYIWYSPLKVF